MGRLSQFKRNAGWGGLARAAIVLALVTVLPTFLWAKTGDWRGVPIVLVCLVLPVLAGELLIRNVERTGSVLRYAGYSLIVSAVVFSYVRDSLGEVGGELLGAGGLAALSLYISAFIVVLSDHRTEVREELWR